MERNGADREAGFIGQGYERRSVSLRTTARPPAHSPDFSQRRGQDPYVQHSGSTDLSLVQSHVRSADATTNQESGRRADRDSGPHALRTVEFLSDVLQRIQEHQEKR